MAVAVTVAGKAGEVIKNAVGNDRVGCWSLDCIFPDIPSFSAHPAPMKRLLLVALLGAILSAVLAPSASAQLATADDVSEADFRIYRGDGTPATMADVRAALDGVDVVFVGELHNDPVSHYIEQRVLEGWFDAHGHAAALSLEMFSRDVQYIVDEYLAGLISDSHFQQASSPWSNYETDYRPLVEYAKDNGLAVIAANAPRRYANMVSRTGRKALLSLSDQARSYLAPLPFAAASERYEAQWNQVMAEAMAAMQSASGEDDAGAEQREAAHGEGEPMPKHEGMRHGDGMQEHEGMHHGEGMRHGEGAMDHAAMREKHHPDMSDEEYEEMKAEKMASMDHSGMDHGNMDHSNMDHSKMDHSNMEHDAAMGQTTHAMPTAQPQHGGGSMLDAQSLWDATMAWSIADHMTRTPGAKVAHFVGGFHVETGTGTPEHLVQYRPGTRMLIISVQSVDDPSTFDPAEHTGLGDFVVLGDASLPRTYETRTR